MSGCDTFAKHGWGGEGSAFILRHEDVSVNALGSVEAAVKVARRDPDGPARWCHKNSLGRRHTGDPSFDPLELPSIGMNMRRVVLPGSTGQDCPAE